MKKVFFALAAVAVFAAAHGRATELSAEDKAAGWKLLFDGTTNKGWHAIGKKEFPAKGWIIEDGALHHQAKAGGGDVVTDDTYDNFELTFEVKIPEGANSGLKYRVEDKGNSAYGCEFQVIDDSKHADAKNGKHITGALYDLIPPKEKVEKPTDVFNQFKIIVQGNHIEHWINGKKVVDVDYGSDDWKKAYAESKFAKDPKFAATPKAHIALQDHGDEVWFRNLKIRELPAK